MSVCIDRHVSIFVSLLFLSCRTPNRVSKCQMQIQPCISLVFSGLIKAESTRDLWIQSLRHRDKILLTEQGQRAGKNVPVSASPCPVLHSKPFEASDHYLQ